IQTIGSAIGFGITQTAFSIYVTQGLGQTNLILGNLFTTSGLASTLFVFPSGFFADKYRRDFLIRISVFFSVLAQLSLIFSITLINSPQLALDVLFMSQILGGLGWGLSGPAAQALIADSIEPGNRSKIFANMHFANLVAAAVGPFLAAALTVFLGDTWEIEVLSIIILVGSASGLLSNLTIVFASDNKALVKKDIETIETSSGGPTPVSESYDLFVPTIIVISGIIIGFGAGATVAFFPVLFASPTIGYGLQPFFTYTVVGITNIATGFAGLGAQRIIRIFGRIATMFLVQGLAIIFLLGLVTNLLLYQNLMISLQWSVLILVIFYVARNALMNASGPISRSIVMDIVPSGSRAKWNSLETLAWGMFWSVSASLGGFIVDNFGFFYVFIFTASLYTIANLIMLFIWNRVPKESILSHTYHLGRLKTRNRVVLPSKMIGDIKAAEFATGQLTREAISYYREIAEGGAGLIYLEPAFINRNGKSHSYQLGIHDDYVIPRLREAVHQIHAHEALIGIQLSHAGGATKKSICGFQPLAPSVVSSPLGDDPRALTNRELIDLVDDFVDAARRATRSGFDVVEICASVDTHQKSDLLGQFLSPNYNQRTDEFGGSLTNRIRFPLKVAQAIKAHLPPKVMFAYYLAVPFHGLSDDELSTVIESIEKTGIDLLSIDYSPMAKKAQESDIAQFIQKIKNQLPQLPLILSGDFDVDSAEKALKLGQAELIGFDQFLRENLTFPQALR
ncbi:MAG: MFS transporter, partial [Candidatus Hodarchaeales archaeon]